MTRQTKAPASRKYYWIIDHDSSNTWFVSVWHYAGHMSVSDIRETDITSEVSAYQTLVTTIAKLGNVQVKRY